MNERTMPRLADPGATDEPGASRCSNPHCRLAPGARALIVTASWSPDTRATLCSWACLVAWSALMELTQRAWANGEMAACRRVTG
jgi:hypothetical protein